MAEEITAETQGSAEKAYAVAAEAVAVKPEKQALKVAGPAAKASAPKPAAATVAAKAKKPAKAAVAIKSKAPAVVEKPASKRVAPVAKPRRTAKPGVTKPMARVSAAKRGITVISQIKDKIMSKTKTTDFTATVKGAFVDAQEKAKAVYGKGAAFVAEASEFTKGNVEAFVESGKILTEGLKSFGSESVAEGKKAVETLTADAKQFAAVKSPVDFFKLQSEVMRRNFDAAVAMSTKNTEAAFKLANEAFAPISSRVSLAVEKVKKAA